MEALISIALLSTGIAFLLILARSHPQDDSGYMPLDNDDKATK